MSVVLITFILYLVILILVGFLTLKLTKTLEDFILAGRRLGACVTAISEKASDFSAWLIVGLPAQAFKMGFAAIWPVIGCLIGSLFNWTVLAKKIRQLSERLNAFTLPDFFEARFQDQRQHLLRLVSTLIIIIFFILYISAQFLAAGKVLHATFGITRLQGMLIGAGIITFYTLMGGFFAVAYTDLIQGLIMALGLLILPIVGIIKIGSFPQLINNISNINLDLLTVSAGKSGLALIFGTIIAGLAIGLGYPGQPHILARYMAIKKPKEIRKATLISMIWVILSLYGAIFIGIVGLGMVGQEISDPDHIMPILTRRVLPDWLAGVLISAAIAAMMSTVDSQILVAISAISEDLYHKMINKKASQKTLLVISRTAGISIAVFAFVLALGAEERVYSLVLYAWGGLAAGLGPPIIMSLRWKRTTKWGILSGMIVGTITIIVWHNIPALKNFCYELVPAFLSSLLIIYIVSLFTTPPNNTINNPKDDPYSVRKCGS